MELDPEHDEELEGRSAEVLEALSEAGIVPPRVLAAVAGQCETAWATVDALVQSERLLEEQCRRVRQAAGHKVLTCFICLKKTLIEAAAWKGSYFCEHCYKSVSLEEGTAGFDDQLLLDPAERLLDEYLVTRLVKHEHISATELDALRAERKTMIPRPSLATMIAGDDLVPDDELEQTIATVQKALEEKLPMAELRRDSRLARQLIVRHFVSMEGMAAALGRQLDFALKERRYLALTDLLLEAGELTSLQIAESLPALIGEDSGVRGTVDLDLYEDSDAEISSAAVDHPDGVFEDLGVSSALPPRAPVDAAGRAKASAEFYGQPLAEPYAPSGQELISSDDVDQDAEAEPALEPADAEASEPAQDGAWEATPEDAPPEGEELEEPEEAPAPEAEGPSASEEPGELGSAETSESAADGEAAGEEAGEPAPGQAAEPAADGEAAGEEGGEPAPGEASEPEGDSEPGAESGTPEPAADEPSPVDDAVAGAALAATTDQVERAEAGIVEMDSGELPSLVELGTEAGLDAETAELLTQPGEADPEPTPEQAAPAPSGRARPPRARPPRAPATPEEALDQELDDLEAFDEDAEEESPKPQRGRPKTGLTHRYAVEEIDLASIGLDLGAGRRPDTESYDEPPADGESRWEGEELDDPPHYDEEELDEGEFVIDDDLDQIQIKRIRAWAKLPTARRGDAGFDLTCGASQLIEPHTIARVPVGIATCFPEGVVAMIAGRSSMAARGLHVIGGVIDSGYRGEWVVLLANLSDQARGIEPGDRVAQALLLECASLEIVEVEELPESERGEGGFGSTGR